MNDALEIFIGLMVCLIPPAVVIAAIVALVRYFRSDREQGRIAELETAVGRLRGENVTLLHRLSRLEEAVGRMAGAPGASDERRIDATGESAASAAWQGRDGSAASAPSGDAPAMSNASASEPGTVSAAAFVAEAGSASASASASEAVLASRDGSASEASLGAGIASSGGAVEAGAGAALGAGAGTGTGAESGTGAGAGTESGTGAGTGTGTGAGAETGAGAGTGAGAETGAGTGTGVVAGVGAVAAAESGAGVVAGAAAIVTGPDVGGAAGGVAGDGGGRGAGVAGHASSGGVPSTPSAARPVSPPGPPPEKPSINWEQWIGVRGAAALGASILVLAGIYFFEYSIEHGLITPAMRMVAGTLVGLGCVLASELRLRKTHVVLANWLGGAGIGILYVAFWAGNAMYHLYPTSVAGLLLVAVTAACVTLAVKRDAPAIAILGLLGGFATPLALSTGSDRPIPLFSYLLLLDGAMLWVAYKRRWPWMALLCLLATAAYQDAWLIGRLDQPRLILGVAIVAVFAIVFAALPKSRQGTDAPEHPIWKLTRSAGVLLPLLITVPLAVRQDLDGTFWPTAVQLVLLTAAAGFVGLRHRSAALPTAAALIGVGAILGWAVAHPPGAPVVVWKVVGLALALAAVHHAMSEVGRRRDAGAVAAIPAAVTHLSLLAIALLSAPWVDLGGPWPWLALWAVLVVLTARLASVGEAFTKLQVAAAALASIGIGVTFAAQVGQDGQPGPGLFLGILVAAAVLMQIGGLLPRAAEVRRDGDHAGATFALLLIPLLALTRDAFIVPSWAMYGGTLLLAVLVLLVAARRGHSAWMIGALLATALAHGGWILRRADGPFSGFELAALGASVLLFALFPIVAPRSLRDQPWSWRTAALAGPLYLLALRHVWLDVLGDGAIGALALMLAGVSIGGAYAVRARGPAHAEARKVAMVWLTVAAAGFVTLAIPLQLSNEWITIGWALEALTLAVLWRRLDHPGLKYLAFALAAAVCVRLMANPYVLGYYPRSSLRVFNWLSYTYLVPAATLFGMWLALRRREVERHRSWERSIFGARHAVMANTAAAAALVVVFAWLNLTIFDWFATGENLRIPLEHFPARDLSLSIAWALYALSLLGIGMWRESLTLRVASLGLILITSGKVFLYDLSHLADLYRVASLAGLAISLIVISLAYQRFVFRKPAAEVAR